MAETKPQGPPSPAEGPSKEHLEERWKEVVDTLTESPRDVDLLVKAGTLSEQLQRPLEAWTYFHKALNLDPTKAFLVTKLKGLAVTPEQKEQAARMAKRPTSFEASLSDIFKYPVRGKGLPVLVIGAIFLWIARALMRNGIGTSGITIAALAGAYMALFYIDVCHTTVGGDDHLPDWPDPLRIQEVTVDILKYLCALVSAFLPVVLILIVLGAGLFSAAPKEDEFPMPQLPRGPVLQQPVHHDLDDGDAPARPATPATPVAPKPPPPPPSFPLGVVLGIVGIAVFGLVGMAYLPMAKLANVVMGSPWTCFNYPFIAHSILATMRPYAICLACYFGITIVMTIAEFAVAAADVIVFTGCGLAFLELYGMTMLMRLLGLFYRMSQAKLGWMAG